MKDDAAWDKIDTEGKKKMEWKEKEKKEKK